MAARSYYTEEGLDKLKKELQELKTTGRERIANAIAEAREKGDLRENAEYDAAKEAQGMHEAKISELENVIAGAQIIRKSDLDTSRVGILMTVRMKNLINKAEMEYTLVSPKEADFKDGKISVDSPVAKGLLGKAVGEVAEIQVPAGIMKFEILEITLDI